MADQAEMRSVWTKVVDMAKQAAVAPAMYRALDASVPIAWEGNVFAIGIETTDGLISGTLKSNDSHMKIEQALRHVTGNRELKVRVLDSPTIEAWNAVKAGEVALARMQQQKQDQLNANPTQAADTATWDDVYDQLNRLWSGYEYRTLASGKGRYLQEALTIVDAAMDKLGGTGGDSYERSFSRTLERVGAMVGSEPALLGYLLFERRRLAGK
jgi:hypothetical protein